MLLCWSEVEISSGLWIFFLLSLCICFRQMEDLHRFLTKAVSNKSHKFHTIKESLPSKVLSRHLIKALVVWLVEIS